MGLYCSPQTQACTTIEIKIFERTILLGKVETPCGEFEAVWWLQFMLAAAGGAWAAVNLFSFIIVTTRIIGLEKQMAFAYREGENHLPVKERYIFSCLVCCLGSLVSMMFDKVHSVTYSVNCSTPLGAWAHVKYILLVIISIVRVLKNIHSSIMWQCCDL